MEAKRTWVSSKQPPVMHRLESLLEINGNRCYYSTVSGTKVFVMPGGMMKSNGNLVELIEKVKPEIRTLIEKCNTVSNNVAVDTETIESKTFCSFGSFSHLFLLLFRSKCGFSCSSLG